MLLRFRGSLFRGNDSFGSDEKAEGGIDNVEDWVWNWYSCSSWDSEDIVRAGLLGIIILAYTLIFLLRGLLRRNLGGIKYIGLLPLVCSIHSTFVRVRPLLLARANPGIFWDLSKGNLFLCFGIFSKESISFSIRCRKLSRGFTSVYLRSGWRSLEIFEEDRFFFWGLELGSWSNIFRWNYVVWSLWGEFVG